MELDHESFGGLGKLFVFDKKGKNRTGTQSKNGGGSHSNREDKPKRGSGESHTVSNPGHSGGSRGRGGNR